MRRSIRSGRNPPQSGCAHPACACAGAVRPPAAADAQAALGTGFEDPERQDPLGEQPDALARLADGDPPRRAPGSQHPLNDSRDVAGWRAVDLIGFHHPDRLGEGRAVNAVTLGRRRHPAARGEVRPEVTGLDQRHVDPEGRHLIGQCLAVPLERELAGAVERLERDAEHAANGADQHETPAALSAHQRQGRLHHPDAAPEVRLQLRLRLAARGELDRSGHAPACRRDHGVDAPVRGDHAADAVSYRIIIVHIHDQAVPAAAGRRAAPAGAHDGPARLVQKIGARQPDSRRGAGDQYHFRLTRHADLLSR